MTPDDTGEIPMTAEEHRQFRARVQAMGLPVVPHQQMFACLDKQYDAMWLARAKKVMA